MAHKILLPISPKAQERFWQKVRKGKPNECWPWFGALTDKGYGNCFPYGAEGGGYRAHRVSFFIVTGVDPGEFGAAHSCDSPPCCNPGHVIPSTQKMNLANMRAKGRDYKFPVISGEKAPHAKLTDDEVAEIRRLAASTPRRAEGRGRQLIPGYWSERRLAEKFGVGATQIARIIRGESRA